MFQDERIDAECGKIYQRGILYATLTALLYSILYGIRLILDGDAPFPTLLNVFFIVLCGAILLIVGAAQYPHGDERCEFERHRYYFRAGKAFILGSLAGYGFAIPFAGQTSNGLPINHILFLLEALGCIYFFYAFKSRGLFFNYTIIDRPKREYYIAVLKNIGKFSAVIGGVFLFAAVLDFGLHQSLGSFWGIVLAGILSALSVARDYFLISLMEKLSHDGAGKLSRGTVVAFAVLLLFTLANELLGIAMAVVLEEGLQASAGMMGFLTAGAMMSTISYRQLCVGLLISAASAMVLGGLLWQTKGKWIRRSIQWILGFSAFSILFGMVNEATMDIAALLFGSDAMQMISQFGNLFSSFLAFVADVLGTWLLIALIKEERVSKIVLLAPVLGIVMAMADLFFTSQSMYLTSAIANTVISLACIGIVLAILYTHKFSPIFEEEDGE